MINLPSNWNEIKEFTERPKLPVDAYVCKVKQVAIQNTRNGSPQICVLFDIFEGEWRNFYADEYESDTRDSKKWKGVLRLFVPKYDGSKNDETTIRILKGFASAFEKSNLGYVFNGDETKLVGKLVGIVFRNEEWEYEGKTGWTARPYRAISVADVRSGEFRLPKDKPLKKEENSSADVHNTYGSYPDFYSVPGNFVVLDGNDSECPF